MSPRILLLAAGVLAFCAPARAQNAKEDKANRALATMTLQVRGMIVNAEAAANPAASKGLSLSGAHGMAPGGGPRSAAGSFVDNPDYITVSEFRGRLTGMAGELKSRSGVSGPLVADALEEGIRAADEARREAHEGLHPQPGNPDHKIPVTNAQLDKFGSWLDTGVDFADARQAADQERDPKKRQALEKKASDQGDLFENKQDELKKEKGPIPALVDAVDLCYDAKTHYHDGDTPDGGGGQNPKPGTGGGAVIPSFPFGYLNNPATGETLHDGYRQLVDGDVGSARSAANRILQSDPANLDALRLAAQSAALQGDNAAANRAARNYLDINPDNKQMQQLEAITANRSVGGSSNAATQAAGLGGGADAGAAGGAGSVEALLGLRALSPNESASRSLADQARAKMALDPDSAIGLASKAISLDAGNANAYFARGVAYERKGDHDDALKDAVSGLAASPKHAALWALKASVLNREGRYAEAREAAEAALALNPRSGAAWAAEANALAGLGDRAGALKALENAAAADGAFRPMYEAAVNAPQDSDLMFLFAADSVAAGRKPAERKRRFGAIAIVAVAGGGLLALALLQFLIPPLKSAFTQLTRKESAAQADPLGGAVALAGPSDRSGLLRGQYKTLRKIGAGGMGEVYEGEDVSLGRKVAIKRMRDEIKADPRERARFVSEAKLVAALHHPSIVDIYAIVEEGSDVFLVFEYIAGRTLHEVIQAKGRLTLDESLPILKSVVEGLEYAHGRGIIHRDLKPSNIMLDEAGRPRVMDFGIARMAKDALTKTAMTNTIVGTPPYMAPEQEQGLVRKESDVYSLALCFYEMLTGRLAFAGTGAGMLINKVNKSFAPATTLAPELPAELDQLFAHALEPEPGKRIATPVELLARAQAATARRA